MKRRVFNLEDSCGSNSSGEGEMIARLKKKFHVTGEKKGRSRI
jgi:hypothetical protein